MVKEEYLTKEEYISVEFEVITFDAADIVTLSGEDLEEGPIT